MSCKKSVDRFGVSRIFVILHPTKALSVWIKLANEHKMSPLGAYSFIWSGR